MGGLEGYCRGLVERARERGWDARAQRAIPYGRQVELWRGGEYALLNCYEGRKGLSAVAGGPAAAALSADLGLAGARTGTAAGATRPPAAGGDPFGAGLPRIGCDESGKGDYFGPLVVAAFRLTADTLPMVEALGVRDSKTVSDAEALRLAGQLNRTGAAFVKVLDPYDYNRGYARTPNVNLLLGRLYGAVLGYVIADSQGPITVVIDRFTTRLGPLREALALPPGSRLITEPRGERDLAVAAASLLARASFLDGLRRLEHDYGHRFPPGAGAPVLQAGRDFLHTFGLENLPYVAKVHFATTRDLTGA